MKRTSLILLILIYSASTFGVSLKKFYCCGKLESVTVVLNDTKEEKCGKGDSNDGCCKTTFQYLKVKDSQVPSAHIEVPLNFSTDLHILTSSLQSSPLIANEIDVINGSHAPPINSGTPIYISNCVFRI